jgi:hypothetical protein
MTKRAFWFGIAAWALVLPGMGCESVKSCQTLCEQANECPNVLTPIEDCAQECTDRDKLLKAAACTSKQQAYDECASKLGDVCDASEQCVTEALTIFDCIDDYCTSDPSACGGS